MKTKILGLILIFMCVALQSGCATASRRDWRDISPTQPVDMIFEIHGNTKVANLPHDCLVRTQFRFPAAQLAHDDPIVVKDAQGKLSVDRYCAGTQCPTGFIARITSVYQVIGPADITDADQDSNLDLDLACDDKNDDAEPAVHALVEISGKSMYPTYPPKALVVVSLGPRSENLKPGKVVTFWNPRFRGFTAHRLVTRTTDYRWITRGDGNPEYDDLPVPDGNIIAVVEGLYKEL